MNTNQKNERIAGGKRKMRNKAIATAAVILAALLAFAGCAGKQHNASVSGISGYGKLVDGVIGGRSEAVNKSEFEAAAADAIKGEKYASSDFIGGKDEYIGEPMPGGVEVGPDNGQITAGTLTAGEIRDIDDLAHWISLWNEKNWSNIKKERGLNTDNVMTATANPLSAISLCDGETPVFTAVTDIYGKAILVFPQEFKNKTLTVKSGELSADVECTPGAAVDLVDKTQVTLRNAAKLDLMLMIDTTGSMGDELEYIKVELKDVIARIRKEQNVDIRVSVNFYRDDGDEYIVKYYDFRSDIDECVKILGEQSADGGGDYPEAVHAAISNIVAHTWRDDAVKLCFMILDAPPHEESEIQGINSGMRRDVASMAARGIRLIPVVSSGADVSVEVLMRSFAVTTGGSYVFLTDDSGIGGSHETPTDTEYDVIPLNDRMVQVVKDYIFVKGE